MLSSVTLPAEVAKSPACTCQTSGEAIYRASSTLCSLSHSMNYIANVLTLALQSPKPTQVSETEDALPSDNEPTSRIPSRDTTGDHRYVNVEDSGHRSVKPRVSRTKTVFKFAHPPPITKHQQRFHIRPKTLIQLQQTSNTPDTRLVFDVIPSTLYASHLAQRIPHHFSSRASHGVDDLAVISSYALDKPNLYTQGMDDNHEDAGTEKQKIMASIHRSKNGNGNISEITEILISGVWLWKAIRLPSGIYEFTHMEQGHQQILARWVPRRKKLQRERTGGPDNIEDPALEKKSFAFSILDPNARRHAVIAKLTPDSIDVADQYSIPPSLTSSSSNESSDAPATSGMLAGTAEEVAPSPVKVDEDLKTLIAITGLWVALCEDYSPVFTFSPNASEDSSHKHRSLSLNLSSNHHTSPIPLQSSPDRKPIKPRLSIQHTVSSPNVPTTPTVGQTRNSPRRTLSIGSAFMHGAKDRRLSAHESHLSTLHSFDESDLELMLEGSSSFAYHDTLSNKATMPDREVITKRDRECTATQGLLTTEGGPVAESKAKASRQKGLRKVFGLHHRKSRVP